jgi:DNA-binding MarR family transcriptional regulator
MGAAMGAIQDLLQEVPLSAVLKERLALAEQKYEGAMRENAELKQQVRALEEENTNLRAQVPRQHQNDLSEDTARVLAHLFRAEGDAQDVGMTARMLQMEKGLVKYHLDQLESADLATCTGFNTISGHVYWALTPAGRKYAVENKLT